MQLPQIRLQQTYAQIGLKITQPVQEMEQPPADLSIQQIPTQLDIERKPAQLQIDQEQARSELNLKGLAEFMEDNVEYAKQAALEATAEIAEEGNQLAAIENKQDAIAAIAEQKANPEPDDFNIAFIPSQGSVKINFIPTEIHLNWKQGGTEIHATSHQPTHHYTPGKTEVYLQQKQLLQIDFVGTNINSST